MQLVAGADAMHHHALPIDADHESDVGVTLACGNARGPTTGGRVDNVVAERAYGERACKPQLRSLAVLGLFAPIAYTTVSERLAAELHDGA
jgi:hypothetical protein